MTETTLNFYISLITLFVLYLVFTLTPKFSRPNMLFGVTLPDALNNHPTKNKLWQYFFKGSTLLFIVFIGLEIFCYLAVPFFSMREAVIIILYVICTLGLYGLTYKKVKQFVSEHTHEPLPISKKVYVDTAYLEEKRQLKNRFFLLYMLPLLGAVGLLLYTIKIYPTLPEMIPTHWNIFGQIDAWQPKSFASAFLPSILACLLLPLVMFSGLSSFTRNKLSPEALAKNKQQVFRAYQFIGISIFLLLCALLGVFALTTFAMIYAQVLKPTYYVFYILLLILSCIILNSGIHKLHKLEKSQTNTAVNHPEDADQYWHWGMIYNNPNDPALFVVKRIGIGWTVNFGRPLGKLFYALILVLLIALCVFAFIYS